MNIVKWDPFRTLLDFPRLGHSFETDNPSERVRSWAPVVDIYENDEHGVVIRAELPGVDKQDVSVGVENGVLTLAGERKTDKELEEGTAYRRERFHGSFRRSFSLPDEVDTDQIAASFKDGVLEIRLPKSERAKPRKIEVNAA
jgi:HSP20 family protein